MKLAIVSTLLAALLCSQTSAVCAFDNAADAYKSATEDYARCSKGVRETEKYKENVDYCESLASGGNDVQRECYQKYLEPLIDRNCSAQSKAMNKAKDECLEAGFKPQQCEAAQKAGWL